MSKKKKIDKNKDKLVKSINNNIRSSVRKLTPTKSGIIVDFLDQVLIGIFLGSVLYLSTFFIKLSSTKGPFQTALAIILYPSFCCLLYTSPSPRD